jgi:hypothetical protein
MNVKVKSFRKFIEIVATSGLWPKAFRSISTRANNKQKSYLCTNIGIKQNKSQWNVNIIWEFVLGSAGYCLE